MSEDPYTARGSIAAEDPEGRVLPKSWAVARWVGLVLACGFGTAAALAIVIVALQTLVGT